MSATEEAMTPAEMKAWRYHLGLSQPDAAALLDVSVRTVCGWEIGDYPIPRAVGMACRWLAQSK